MFGTDNIVEATNMLKKGILKVLSTSDEIKMILMVVLWFGWTLGPDVAIIMNTYIDYAVRVDERGAW